MPASPSERSDRDPGELRAILNAAAHALHQYLDQAERELGIHPHTILYPPPYGRVRRRGTKGRKRIARARQRLREQDEQRRQDMDELRDQARHQRRDQQYERYRQRREHEPPPPEAYPPPG